jgi:hypothetical protein
MATRVHVALALRLKLKLWGNDTGLWFSFIRLTSEKYKIMSRKQKEFEDLKNLLVSFRLYFVIAGDSLYLYYLLL